jgi:XTP/dITP diphosphohydrolase
VKTYVATKNAGKLVEMQAIFAGSALELATYPHYADVAEGESSYVENALVKARALAAQLREAGIHDAAVLADDSGIEVEAMQNRPGVLSARYAGEHATWPERLALMLGELRDAGDGERAARFVCVMALALPGGRELIGRGTVEGVIARDGRGTAGFGYDPIFFYPPRGVTFAELSAQEKNAVSHRRRAAEAVLEALKGDG